jgi:hypothetical protein
MEGKGKGGKERKEGTNDRFEETQPLKTYNNEK